MNNKPNRHNYRQMDRNSYKNDDENQHEYNMDELYTKVSTLKDISIQIGDHARQDNRDLDTLQTGFSGLDGLLNSTISKIKTLSDAGGNYTCYTILFALFILMVLYFVIR